MIFEDRRDAGKRLAEALSRYRNESPAIFALPRGGVPVGYEVSRSLNAPLSVVVARKLGAPGQREFGIGAVAPGGVRVLNKPVVEQLGITEGYLERVSAREREEMERQMREFRGSESISDLGGYTAILVDDGLATGVTAHAAVRALKKRRPRRIVLAVPVCAAQTVRTIRSEVDDLISLETPSDLGAIGFWYRDFEQVSDDEVIGLLDRAREFTR